LAGFSPAGLLGWKDCIWLTNLAIKVNESYLG